MCVDQFCGFHPVLLTQGGSRPGRPDPKVVSNRGYCCNGFPRARHAGFQPLLLVEGVILPARAGAGRPQVRDLPLDRVTVREDGVVAHITRVVSSTRVLCRAGLRARPWQPLTRRHPTRSHHCDRH
jgi:hypothetical protein